MAVDRFPLFPLGTVLFPGVLLPLHVFEPRYRAMVDDLRSRPEPWSFGVLAIREGHEVGAESVRSLYDVGCAAVVRQVEQLPDGGFALLVVGSRRFRVLAIDGSLAYLQADVDWLHEATDDGTPPDALVESVREAFATYHATLVGPEALVELPDDPTMLSYAIAAAMAIGLPERQALLEAPDASQRLRTEVDLLHREIALMRTLRTVPLAQPPLPRHSQN